jgi:hypothetical protein
VRETGILGLAAGVDMTVDLMVEKREKLSNDQS